MIDTSDIDVFLGLDVGKGEHHATAVTPAGKKAFDKRLPNTEPKLRELFAKLQAKHGTVLVVVDQPASIGALPLAVARDMGCPVAYLPGLTMRRIADLYPGEAKTDAKDAYIIADAARACWARARTAMARARSLSSGRGRWACMSVRRMFARTRASPGSDFLRETACRSRYRAAANGLIANTGRFPVRSTATSRPRLVSIATGIGFSSVSPYSASRYSRTL